MKSNLRGDEPQSSTISASFIINRLAGAWIAAGVEVYSDGKKVFSEDYSDIQANVKLEPAVFDPEKFSTTHWEK